MHSEDRSTNPICIDLSSQPFFFEIKIDPMRVCVGGGGLTRENKELGPVA